MTIAKNIIKIKGTGGEIVLYRTKDGRIAVDVRLEKDTLWLVQKDMAALFSTERSVITKHINNIFQSGELHRESNVQKMHIPGSDKPVDFTGDKRRRVRLVNSPILSADVRNKTNEKEACNDSSIREIVTSGIGGSSGHRIGDRLRGTCRRDHAGEVGS